MSGRAERCGLAKWLTDTLGHIVNHKINRIDKRLPWDLYGVKAALSTLVRQKALDSGLRA